MGRSGFGSRVAGALVVAAAFVLLGPASASAALTKPERKAVDIAGVDAKTTSDTAFAAIHFKGKIADELGTGGLKNARVTIELVPASGPTTVITDRKPSRKPKEKRTGTAGRFDVVRNGRAILLLVEDLPAPPAQFVVTTSDPTSTRSRTLRRGFEPSDHDVEVGDVEAIVTKEQIDNSIEVAGETVGGNESQLKRLDKEADKTIDDIARAERELRQAKGGGAARDARERLEKSKAKLKELTETRKALRAENRLLERWTKVLQDIQSGETKRQCNDGVDNGDPEDTIADHPNDSGCVEPVDNDEKHTLADLVCPGEGGFIRTFFDIYTPTSNSIAGYRMTTPDGTVIAAGNEASVPPTQLAESVCGGNSTTTFSYGAGSNARQRSGFPPFSPPSGDTGARFVLEVNNPAGGDPSASSATVIAALNTRGQ